jgi:hypothetical protein
MLEHEADVVAAEAVAFAGAELGEVASEHLDAPGRGGQHAADEAEQRALAAATGAAQEQALAARDRQLCDVEQQRLAGPREADLIDQHRRACGGSAVGGAVCGRRLRHADTLADRRVVPAPGLSAAQCVRRRARCGRSSAPAVSRR